MADQRRDRRWLLAGATALAASWAFALNRGPVKAGQETATVGATAVANGAGTLSVGGPAEHVTVLEFFASWCGACASAVPRAERVSLASGARWIAVSVDDTADAAVAAARDWRLEGPVVHDPRGMLRDSFQISVVPSLVVLRRDGSVSFSAVGALPESEIRSRIDEAHQSAR